MNIFKTLAIAVLMSLAVVAQAQELKFAHIDSQKLMSELQEFQDAQQVLKAEVDKIQASFQEMQADLQKKYEEYLGQRETMPEIVRNAKEKELTDGQQRLEEFQNMAQQSLASKEQQLLAPIMQKYEEAIKSVGAENGFIYIFDISSQVVLYHSQQSIDAAPLVKAKMSAK